eukprot:SAG11_NODE_1524_length_4746_cov_5.271358_6_plen_110_part_00
MCDTLKSVIQVPVHRIGTGYPLHNLTVQLFRSAWVPWHLLNARVSASTGYDGDYCARVDVLSRQLVHPSVAHTWHLAPQPRTCWCIYIAAAETRHSEYGTQPQAVIRCG